MVYVTISGLHGHRTSVSALDPQLQGLGEDQFSGPSQELYLLDSDADDIPSKLEMYIKKTASLFFERETSPFMKPTMVLASELALSQKVCSQHLKTRLRINTSIGHFARTCCGPVGRHSHLGRPRAYLEDLLQPHSSPYLNALTLPAL